MIQEEKLENNIFSYESLSQQKLQLEKLLEKNF